MPPAKKTANKPNLNKLEAELKELDQAIAETAQKLSGASEKDAKKLQAELADLRKDRAAAEEAAIPLREEARRATAAAQNEAAREQRIIRLARKNRDVAALLEERDALKAAAEKKNKS